MDHMDATRKPRDPELGASAATSSMSNERRSRDRRQQGADRRVSLRQPLSVAVRQEVMAQAGHPAELHLAQSADLGLGGMRLLRRCDAHEPLLPQHTPVRLAFQLPDDRQLLEVAGEVAFDRAAQDGSTYRATGVRFDDLPVAVRERLRMFLKDG